MRTAASAVRRPDARVAAVKAIAWSGLLLPAAIVEARAPKAVVDDPFTAVTLLRGLAPALCLVAAVALARPLLRPVGTREWLLAGYLLVVVASATWSLAPRATLLKAGHLVVAYALLVLLARQWRSREEAFRELSVVVYGVVVVAALTAVVVPGRAHNQYTGRLVAVFPSLQSVTLGLFAAVGLVMLTAGSGPDWIMRRLPVRVLLAVTSLVVLLLTGARTAFVLAVLGTGGFLLARDRTSRRRELVACAVAFLLVLVSPLGRTLRDRLYDDDSGSLLDFGHRLPLWDLALQAVQHQPLVGYGYYAGHRLGRYATLFYDRIDPTQLPYVDGTWIETLLDLGVVGVLALLAFVAYTSWRIIAARDGTRASSLQVCLLLIGLCYSIQDFTLQQVGYPMVLLGSVLLGPLVPAAPVRDHGPGR